MQRRHMVLWYLVRLW